MHSSGLKVLISFFNCNTWSFYTYGGCFWFHVPLGKVDQPQTTQISNPTPLPLSPKPPKAYQTGHIPINFSIFKLQPSKHKKHALTISDTQLIVGTENTSTPTLNPKLYGTSIVSVERTSPNPVRIIHADIQALICTTPSGGSAVVARRPRGIAQGPCTVRVSGLVFFQAVLEKVSSFKAKFLRPSLFLISMGR